MVFKILNVLSVGHAFIVRQIIMQIVMLVYWQGIVHLIPKYNSIPTTYVKVIPYEMFVKTTPSNPRCIAHASLENKTTSSLINIDKTFLFVRYHCRLLFQM